MYLPALLLSTADFQTFISKLTRLAQITTGRIRISAVVPTNTYRVYATSSNQELVHSDQQTIRFLEVGSVPNRISRGQLSGVVVTLDLTRSLACSRNRRFDYSGLTFFEPLGLRMLPFHAEFYHSSRTLRELQQLNRRDISTE